MSQTCPACGAEAPGRFCSECGAAVRAECAGCGHALAPGARFCNECGRPVAGEGAAPARSASLLPWIAAGAIALVLAAVLLAVWVRDEGEQAPATLPAPAVPPAAAGGAAGVDLSQMTPREAADRLFNRVMEALSRGDTAQARTFLPMAVAAYDRVGALDADGRYHLAALHLAAGDPAAAREEARAILADDPGHLFGLFTAAQAARALGETAESERLFRDFLGRFDAETARDLPEYRDHANALPSMRAEARSRVGTGG